MSFEDVIDSAHRTELSEMGIELDWEDHLETDEKMNLHNHLGSIPEATMAFHRKYRFDSWNKEPAGADIGLTGKSNAREKKSNTRNCGLYILRKC